VKTEDCVQNNREK